MPEVSIDLHQRKKQTLAQLRLDRRSWWQHWRDLADFIMPRRYTWLLTNQEYKQGSLRNTRILDATGTTSARTLAAGMMNGVTSPARPWFRLRVPGVEAESGPVRIWLDDVQKKMLLVMAESNYYNSLAVLYLDLVVFGSAAMLMYEDYDEVIRCYNSALGEFYFAHDYRLRVNTFARDFTYKVHQVVDRWGIENCSEAVKDAYAKGGAHLQYNVRIVHLIEPRSDKDNVVNKRFSFQEFYWEEGFGGQTTTSSPGTGTGKMLEVTGYREVPGIFSRWEITGNDAYGHCPGMDALPDIIQLQFETKAKAKSLDNMNDPALLVDAQLQHQPTALQPRGVTYVHNLTNTAGAKPVHTLTPPLQEMAQDILDIRARIREIFHNDLFKMIAQLETVRSATEISALREEKLVLLGPVLERFANEALDPSISRLFGIMSRKGMFLPPPPELTNVELEIQYVSVLSDAQRAVGTAAHERLAQFVGNLAAVKPEVLNIPNWDGLVRDYAERIGVPGKALNSEEESQGLTAQQKQIAATQQAAVTGEVLTKGAKNLSETDLGGGATALQQLLGS